MNLRLQPKYLLSTLFAVMMLIGIGFNPIGIQAQEQPDSSGIINFKDVDDDTFDQLNPLKTTGSDQAEQLSTPGGIITRVLEFAFPIAGLILFVMIVWGGFETLAGAASKKSLDAGKQRVTAAIIGFLLLFVSYWMIRVIETALGIKVIF